MALIAMYLLMTLSTVMLETAYLGYLFSFAVFVVAVAPEILRGRPERGSVNTVMVVGWALFLILALGVMIGQRPAFSDLFRDSGAILSFLIGFLVIPRALGRDWERPLFAALSALAMIISVWTIVGAVRAYFAGVNAYEWRGYFVPYAHSWLPYLLIAEYVRSRSGVTKPEISAARIGFCVFALLLSLSRTGLVLLLIFGPATLLFNARKWLFSARGMLIGGLAVILAAIALPRLLGLEVVQERIGVGLGSDDLSLAWRAMENATLEDYMSEGGWLRWLVGYGLGARLPLPWGVVDFAGNTSIPHLHNSYMTLILKFGLIGLGWILISIARLVAKAHIVRNGGPGLRVGGTWILIFVLGTAVTFQGMSEWSHLTFLGLSCAMLAKAGRSKAAVPHGRNPTGAPLAKISTGGPSTDGSVAR